MRKHFVTLWVIVLSLVIPTSSFADAGWPMLIIAVSPVVMWYTGIISILIEASVLWHFLRLGFVRALLMSLSANIASLFVGILLGGMGVGYLGETPLGTSFLAATIFGSWHASMIIMLLLSLGTEAVILRGLWNCSWRKLWLPLLIMNILSYLLIEGQFLWDNYLT